MFVSKAPFSRAKWTEVSCWIQDDIQQNVVGHGDLSLVAVMGEEDTKKKIVKGIFHEHLAPVLWLFILR